MLAIKLLSNEVAYGNGATAQIKLYEEGVEIAPTSGNFSLYDLSNTLVIDSEAMTLTGNILSYVINSTFLDTLGLNYRIYVEGVDHDGNAFENNFFIDVVKTPLVLSVIDNDLLSKEPDLLSDLPTTQTSFTKQIESAFEEVKGDIRIKDNRSSLIVDGSKIASLIILKALENVYFFFSTDADGVNWQKYLKYSNQYAKDFSNLRIAYDVDEDGEPDITTNYKSMDLLR